MSQMLLPGGVHLLLLLVVLTAAAFATRAPAFLRRLRWILAALTVWSWVFVTPAFANWAVTALEGRAQDASARPPARDAASLIVILASGQQHTGSGRARPRLDAEGWERLHTGIDLWKATGGRLLLAGGPDAGPNRSLASLMREVALEAGVPGDAILLVANSRTTYEDLSGVREIAAAHRGPTWLVTSAMHMPRALAVATRLGLSVEPYRCDFRQIEEPTWWVWVPNNAAPRFWGGAIHEIVARLYYRLRGWSD